MNTHLLDVAKKLKFLADTGLLYAGNPYDKERYTELHTISRDLFAIGSGLQEDQLEPLFQPVADYPTAKVDIRGLLLDEQGRILLVREQADGCWSLPGGWADVGNSPKETIEKEFAEEAGLTVRAGRLLAVFDKRKHPHPPQPFYVYKLVVLCTASPGQPLQPGFDVLEVAFWPVSNLPPLSTDRILEQQLQLVYDLALRPDAPAWMD